MMADAVAAEREARDEVKKLVKLWKINRGEPINPAPTPRPESSNGKLPNDMLDQVYAAAKKAAAGAEDGGFTKASVKAEMPQGISLDTVEAGIEQMRHPVKDEAVERIRLAGRRKNGRLFKLKERRG
jgi:hypothetical protein